MFNLDRIQTIQNMMLMHKMLNNMWQNFYMWELVEFTMCVSCVFKWNHKCCLIFFVVVGHVLVYVILIHTNVDIVMVNTRQTNQKVHWPLNHVCVQHFFSCYFQPQFVHIFITFFFVYFRKWFVIHSFRNNEIS